MPTTLTQLAGGSANPVFTPELVVGYSATYPTGNTFHDVLNASSPIVTTTARRLRQGSMTLLFATELVAQAAALALSNFMPFQLSTTDLSGVDMTFFVSGDTTITLDPETQILWTVAFAWREVTL